MKFFYIKLGPKIDEHITYLTATDSYWFVGQNSKMLEKLESQLRLTKTFFASRYFRFGFYTGFLFSNKQIHT